MNNPRHANPTPPRATRCIGLAVLLILLSAGCARYSDLSAFNFATDPTPVSDPYHVGPPDVLSIQSSVVNEVNNATVAVSPEGTIMLPLLGTYHAAGKTTQQISDELRLRAQQYYQDADITVNVQQYRSKFVYVFGEVRAAGRYPYTGSDTVLQLLATAQPTRAADDSRIQILRPDPAGDQPRRMTVKLSQWIKEGRTGRNALLEPGDIVFVPPNGFAEIGYAVQNLLRPVSPAAATMQGTVSVDNSATTLSGRQ